MRISLMPMRMDARLDVEVRGETLILNGEAVDLSATTRTKPLVPEGEMPWIIGEVTRGAEGLALTLLLPHGPQAPDATRYPKDIVVLKDGAVSLPPHEETGQTPDVAPDVQALLGDIAHPVG